MELTDAIPECAVCLEPISKDNKVLPCQHTFCKICLLDVKKAQGESMKCPECLKPVKEEINKLPSNISLNRILEQISQRLSPVSCGSNKAVKRKRIRRRLIPPVDSDSEDEPKRPTRKPKKKLVISEDESSDVDNSENASASEAIKERSKFDSQTDHWSDDSSIEPQTSTPGKQLQQPFDLDEKHLPSTSKCMLPSTSFSSQFAASAMVVSEHQSQSDEFVEFISDKLSTQKRPNRSMAVITKKSRIVLNEQHLTKLLQLYPELSAKLIEAMESLKDVNYQEKLGLYRGTEELHVSVNSEYTMVNIRVWYHKGMELKPSLKGAVVQAEDFEQFMQNVQHVLQEELFTSEDESSDESEVMREKNGFDSETNDSLLKPQTSTPGKQLQKSARSSSRIEMKKNKELHMPSRRQVFDAISKSPLHKSFDELRNRKTVNDFTKVTSRYNYDAYETSGEEDFSDFIDEDSDYLDEDLQHDEECLKKPKDGKKSSRTKKAKRRLEVNSDVDKKTKNSQQSSSSETDGCSSETDGCSSETDGCSSETDGYSSDSDIRSSETDSSEKESMSSDIGELSKSILEKVSERSMTMSDRKKAKANAFQLLRKSRQSKFTKNH